ncbi:MAG: PHP domain-containing protein [Armatimonadota bacterium]
MLARYLADLHVHTLLSPCGEVEMIPPLIVAQAIELGLDMIAISDHNSAENVRAVMKAAEGSPLKVLPGLECESVEGVHIVCLFDRADDAESMQELVYSALPNLPNDGKKLGEQMVVTHNAEFVRYNERLLLASTSLEIVDIVQAVEDRSGIAIPAHVDRIAYGLYGVLGFLPEDVNFPAVEISKHITETDARAKYPDLNGRAVISSSDAHMLADLGSARTAFNIERRCVSEIMLAFEGRDGRSVGVV